MRKILILTYLFITQIVFAKTAEEHYKEAEQYSEKSKQGYIFAALALVFVIAVKFINKDKKD